MNQSAFPAAIGAAQTKYAEPGARALSVSSGLLFMAVLLEPIYLLPNGVPQISDIFFVAFIAASLLASERGQISPLFTLLLYVFGFWVFSVTAFWAMFLSMPLGMLHALYIIYNGIICWRVAVHTAASDKLLKAIAVGSLVSLCIQALLVVTSSDAYRATGTANNPNQFGYWALNAVAVSFLADRYWPAFRKWAILAAIAAATVLLHSISRAAGAAFAMMLAILALQSRKSRALAVALGILAAPLIILTPSQISTITSQISIITGSELFDRWQKRISHSGEGLSVSESLTYRAYDRIFNYPEYLAFGASALAPGRFGSYGKVYGKEIHSTFGNLIFSYGIIGLTLFLSMLAVVIYGNLHNAVFLLPAIVYGFTHNGIRSTLLWILIGLLVGLSGRLRPSRSPRRAYAHG